MWTELVGKYLQSVSWATEADGFAGKSEQRVKRVQTAEEDMLMEEKLGNQAAHYSLGSLWFCEWMPKKLQAP